MTIEIRGDFVIVLILFLRASVPEIPAMPECIRILTFASD